MRRGEIWWATLPAPRKSGPGYRRPVVIVQSDAFNRSRIGTIVVAAVSSNLKLADAPGNVSLTRRQSKLPKRSVINASQMITLDRSYLTERVAGLSSGKMRELDAGLRLVLEL